MILIVDDYPDFCTTIRTYLSHHGYTSECVFNGTDALQKMSEAKPQLVILDVMMPEMHGMEVLRRMRQDDHLSDVPVVMFSAGMPTDMPEALELGVLGWLLKGSAHSLDQLMSIVRRAVPQPSRPLGPH